MTDLRDFQRNVIFSLISSLTPTLVLAQADQNPVLEEVIVKGIIQSYRGGVPLEDTPQAVQVMSKGINE